MADNNKPAGFGRLMRYADNLADYTRAKEDGLIDDDVFVIVLEEQVAKFKGKTFDWGDVDLSSLASKEDLQGLQDEIISNEEVTAASLNELNDRINELGDVASSDDLNALQNEINNKVSQTDADGRYISKVTEEHDVYLDIAVADGFVTTSRDKYYYLPDTAPAIADDAFILATKADLGNVDTSNLATKAELEEAEEVAAAAFNDVNERINALSENVSGTTVTKEELESTVETINQTISDNKSATDVAIEGLETSIGNVDAKFANYATTESLNGAIETINNTIIENEEITAAAINDLNTRLAALEAAIANL